MADVTAAQIAASETPAAQPSEPAAEVTPPVEPVAPDTTETVAETDEQKNARELAEQRERSEKRARGVQRRMDELTADKYAERERALRAERLLEQMWQQRQPGTQQPAEEQEPQREQFSDYEDFVAAKAEFRAAKRAEAILAKRLDGAAQASREMQVQAEASQLRQRFVAKQQEFAKTTPDYFDVVNTEDVRVPEATAALLHTMDDAPQVIYHLAKNPETAARLWNEPPVRQAILLGQLSATLKGTPQVSKAPEPGKPTGARSGESGTPPSDMEGYVKWRAKQRSGHNA
jgi:hypothetical protein